MDKKYGPGPMMRELPKNERPREKLLASGAAALSNAELIALLLGSGSSSESAVSLASRVLGLADCGLGGLNSVGPDDLKKINGIGDAKAGVILAAIELGKRIATSPAAYRPRITTPDDAAALFMEELRYLKKEEFRLAMFNVKCELIGKVCVSVGGINSSSAHPREVFEQPVKRGAHCVIISHNHPSGDPSPSTSDIELTKRLSQAGNVLGIELVDHIIIGDGRYVSFKEQGLLSY